MLTASAWGYTKYSGKYPAVGVAVDGWTSRVWELVVQPLVGQVGARMNRIKVVWAIKSGFLIYLDEI